MSKMTLLQVTQSILNVIDGDYVTSISETEEAEQVAALARDVYHEFMTVNNWEHLQIMTHMTGLADLTMPIKAQIPETISDITCLRYEYTSEAGSQQFKQLEWLEPNEFLDLLYSRNESDSDITRYTEDQVPLLINTTQTPTYYTSFDDKHIWVDSLDKSQWDTLIGSHLIVEAIKNTEWVMTDDHIPDMPQKLFPAYLAELRDAANTFIRQQPTAYDAKTSKRSLNRMRHVGGRIDGNNTIQVHKRINQRNIR